VTWTPVPGRYPSTCAVPDEQKRDPQKPAWLPADTDRATYRLLTSKDDPHYSRLTISTTVRLVSCEAKSELKR